MQIRGHNIGVCSWSVQPADMADLIAKVRQLELGHVQVAVAPLLQLEPAARAAELDLLRRSGLTVTATMISFSGEDYSSIATIRATGGVVPDEHWSARRDLALRAAGVTAELRVQNLGLHIGFVPASNDASYQVLVHRVRDMADDCAAAGVNLLMETGQESASALLQFLNDTNRRNVAVNFDPANMILYGAGDPVAAIAILNRHIKHVHVKDAVASSQPRVGWGKEVTFGTGQVDPQKFLDALDAIDYAGPLVIEREAGTNRIGDVRAAIRALSDAE